MNRAGAWNNRAGRWNRNLKKALSALALYLSVVGLVTFTLFILEESIQMATFGSWPAQQAKDWRTALAACDQIRTVNRMLKIINYGLGWIQPLAFLSYRAYGHSTDIYVAGLEAKIFAHAPELFAGRTVTFTFTAHSVEKTVAGFLARNGHIAVFSRNPMRIGVARRVTGRVHLCDDLPAAQGTAQPGDGLIHGAMPDDVLKVINQRHVSILVLATHD